MAGGATVARNGGITLKDYHFKALNDEQSMAGIYEGVAMLLRVESCEFVTEFATSFCNTIKHLKSVVSKCSDAGLEKEWIPAAKRHKSKFDKLCTQIFMISKQEGISNPVVHVGRHTIRFVVEKLDVIEEHIEPRSFWPCYRMLRFLQLTKTANQLTIVLQLLTSLFSLYKDLAVEGPTLDRLAEECIAEQLTTELRDAQKTSYSKDIMNLFWKHIDACLEGVEEPNNKVAKEYVSFLKLQRMRFERPRLTPDQLRISSASAGATMKGMESTLPGFLAQPYEGTIVDSRDNERFYKISGYSRPSYIRKPRGFKTQEIKSIFLHHRSKPDVRQIFIPCNHVQDMQTFHAILMESYCKGRSTIVVYRQENGVYRTKENFARNYNAENSLDLHACTNTYDVNHQGMCYRKYLDWVSDFSEEEKDELLSHWKHYMTLEVHARLPYSKRVIKYSMATGQQMGIASSVQSLNLTHDMDTTAMEWFLCPLFEEKVSFEQFETENFKLNQEVTVEDLPPLDELLRNGYKAVPGNRSILGDDFQNAFKHDPALVFPRLYQSWMAELNVECNLSKGYIYNRDIKEYSVPLAEFAKNLICDGINITPIPFLALCRCNTVSGKLSLLLWYKQRAGYRTIDPEIVAVESGISTELCIMLGCSAVNNIIRQLLWHEGRVPEIRGRDFKVALCYTIPYLKQNILLKTLNELKRDENYVPRSSDYKMIIGPYRRFARTLYESRSLIQNTKFITLMSTLELIAISESMVGLDLLKGENSYFQDIEIIDLIPIVGKMKTYDIEALLRLLDLIGQLESEIEEGEAEGRLTDDVYIPQIWSSCERIFSKDYTSTWRRYGDGSGKPELGLDFQSIAEDGNRLIKRFSISEDALVNSLNYLRELLSKNDKTEFWTTYSIDVDTIFDLEENRMDEEDDLEWFQSTFGV